MISSLTFRNYKALRSTQIRLGPFNLVIGPNGSGKTSLIEAILRLQTLARLPLGSVPADYDRFPDSAEIAVRFDPPHDGAEAVLSCISDSVCDLLQLVPLYRGSEFQDWPGLRARLLSVRAYSLNPTAIAAPHPHNPSAASAAAHLQNDGGHLAAHLTRLAQSHPATLHDLEAELCRLFPEYSALLLQPERGTFALRLADSSARHGTGTLVSAVSLSQGTLYTLALLALVFDPAPPAILCLEELDRGLHPHLLRSVRDLLYRLSYPADYGHNRPPTQVIATTHSPLLLDHFRDHPEEIIISDKVGTTATFANLAERPDLRELLAEGGTLGDLWYSGILGGVPDVK